MQLKRVFKIYFLLLILIFFIFGLFNLWQFGLYQRFSKETSSCGGDWSYNVQCPIGSYCQSLGKGPLVGGLCRPFISSFFDVFNKFKGMPSVQNLPTPIPPTQLPLAKVFIQLQKTTYKAGEPIVFTITNNTQQNIYYFPETCAGNLVQVFILRDDNLIPIQGDRNICMLAPSVEILLPNKSIEGKITDKTLSKMIPGEYKITFEYSIEKKDRFAIGERSVVDSEIFTIVK